MSLIGRGGIDPFIRTTYHVAKKERIRYHALESVYRATDDFRNYRLV